MFDDDDLDEDEFDDEFEDDEIPSEVVSAWDTLNRVDEDMVARHLDQVALTSIRDILDTNLRLMTLYGDAHPNIAEHCRDIQSGLLSLLVQLKNDLPTVCMEVLTSLPQTKQLEVIEKLMIRLRARESSIRNFVIID